MKNNTGVDARIIKTKAKLVAVFRRLLSEKSFEDITVNADYSACAERNITLVKVGPLTYILGQYGEAFNPDSVATMDNVFLENISFNGELIEDEHRLVATVNKQNGTYRLVTNERGTGYGEVGRVSFIR